MNYKILRKDLLANQGELEALLKQYEADGLNVDEEVAKLINLGYIAKETVKKDK
jgi:hypothetical protein